MLLILQKARTVLAGWEIQSMYSLITIRLICTQSRFCTYQRWAEISLSRLALLAGQYIYLIKVGMDNNRKAGDDNPIVAFLQSDVTLYIAIALTFLGMIVMAIFILYLEGMAKVHVSVVTFLFFGLLLSLLYFKALKSNQQIKSDEVEQEKKNKQQ